MTPTPVSLLVVNAKQVLTLANGPVPRRGDHMRDLSIIENGAIAIDGETIVAVGTSQDLQARYQATQTIDATGKVVLPGFIDPHTHIIFAGSREQEFEMRIEGKSYMEISAAGGGIKSSVRQFRAASKKQLTASAMQRLDRFLASGVTTVEVKSGYGLRLEDELKALEVARDLNKEHCIDIVTTFMGAHDFPEEFQDQHEDYIQLIINKMLPAVAESGLAEFCDIFCERGVFEIEDSRHILEQAKKLGFKLKLHADEIAPLGGAELAVELGATSADHLMAIRETGIDALAKSETIAVLLPATSFHLGLTGYAPARKLIERGAAVALSTDCNPGSSMTESLLFVINIAAAYLKMTAAEAITACTVNAAAALDKNKLIGRLQAGMQADIIILDIPNYQYLPYHMGLDCVETVIKKGELVRSRS